ncbi:arginine--tRNA ligase [Membranihabitans maritimus]|uniref:arginine--tRNA ligase n=1 Tax=Membranihabitans maritimus TaxID=2904244 RepID=UPI001EFF9203|nr:arginine--tRNA ligase [Membranihabitans maritimus]
MWVREKLETLLVKALGELYNLSVVKDDITINVTRPEFDGEYTFVMFPFIPKIKRKPQEIGDSIGDYLKSKGLISGYNIVKGFLNLSIKNNHWLDFADYVAEYSDFGKVKPHGEKVIVEFSSPNTNKPLHLGHIRNILLGWSVYKILKETGYDVTRTQIINDRGIAICKSMLAWNKWGGGKTPDDTGIKGDHFVGDFYVRFESNFKEEYTNWQLSEEGQLIYSSVHKEGQSEKEFFSSYKNQYFNLYSKLGAEAREMLISWENGDRDTVALWKQMNQWVYNGFDKTYDALGIIFDKNYYESSTYLEGKKIVNEGLKEKVFFRKDDGSVWVDLEERGMDKKLLLRKDGTSVYITQDLGTAELRYKEMGANKMIYVVADEQNYHFDVLFEICKILNKPYSGGMYHLSYGMVDLPTGKMKSREGTVVDADDLIAEVKKEAGSIALEKGEINLLEQDEKDDIIHTIGIGALKFHMIKVQPQKRMVFDPKESVDMQGQTGPYIQNAYVRIQSILRKNKELEFVRGSDYAPSTMEKELLVQLSEYPVELKKASEEFDPSVMANFSYKLAKTYHRFYNEHRVLSAESEEARQFRIVLSQSVAKVLKRSMNLLGIDMPNKM